MRKKNKSSFKNTRPILSIPREVTTNEVTPDDLRKLFIETRKELGDTQITLKKVIDKLDKVTDELEITRKELGDTKDELDRTIKNSYIDALTGCYNQNYFIKYKNENFDIERKNNKVAFAVVDINNLKKVNDTQGHRAGDKLISDCADNLRSLFRRCDIIIRIGGDEFVVVCDNHENIEKFEESLRNSINDKLRKKKIANLALGIAAFNVKLDTCVDDTIGRADKIMYEDKRLYKQNHKK